MSRSELEAHVAAWEVAVAGDAGIDPFCSGPAWQLAYHDAFAPDRPLWLARDGDDMVVLAEREATPVGVLLEPLEDMWGFASPLLGEGATALLARALRRDPRRVLLLGLPVDRRRLVALADVLSEGFTARALRPTTRFVASLTGGLDGWMSRRSRRFVRNLRSAVRRVEDAGIAFRFLSEPAPADLPGLYARVLDVESRTWKATSGNAADTPPMRDFYALLWQRLAASAGLRVLLAERAGVALGYVHGAVTGRHFRGFQMSFDDTLRPIGLGNVLQLEMIRRLCAEGVEHYDLGAHNDYKARWAEPGLTTFGLLVEPVEDSEPSLT